jgi:hypothetical protein
MNSPENAVAIISHEQKAPAMQMLFKRSTVEFDRTVET